MTEPHPRWGQPLGQYYQSYDIQNAEQRGTLGPDIRFQVLEAIRVISMLGDQSHPIDITTETGHIPLSELKLVLKHSVSLAILGELARPALISGCLRLMAAMNDFGKVAPFSYEYGYVCFRIIAVTLAVCILGRSNELGLTAERFAVDPTTNDLQVLSSLTSRAIDKEICVDEDNCEWLLGWIKSPHHLGQSTLMSRSDLSMFLHMIWEDRKSFLAACLFTFLPGLSAVFFSLWRVTRGNISIESKTLYSNQLREILWRYMLVTTPEQYPVLKCIDETVTDLRNHYDHPQTVDIEDSRIILQAYNGRLTPAIPQIYPPLDVETMSWLLRFVVPHAQPGSVDLLPTLFGSTLARCWEIIIDRPQQDATVIPYLFMHMGDLFKHFGHLFQSLSHRFYSDRYALVAILEAMVENDALDLIGRLIVLLNPTPFRSPHLSDENGEFLGNTQFMFLELAKIALKQLLEHTFRGYAPDWLKYNRHLDTLMFCTMSSRHPSIEHFLACRKLWGAVAHSLGLEPGIKREQAQLIACDHPRCSDPVGLGRTMFICGGCTGRAYCSSRCQQGDWPLGGQESHSRLCRVRIHPL